MPTPGINEQVANPGTGKDGHAGLRYWKVGGSVYIFRLGIVEGDSVRYVPSPRAISIVDDILTQG